MNVYESTLDFRFSFKEKMIDDEFMRIYVSSDYPIIHVAFTAGQAQYLGQTDVYSKIHTTIKHRVFYWSNFF